MYMCRIELSLFNISPHCIIGHNEDIFKTGRETKTESERVLEMKQSCGGVREREREG